MWRQPELQPGTSRAAPGRSRSSAWDKEMASVFQSVLELQNFETREHALLRLSENREIREDLGPVLWNSFGTVAILVQEVVSALNILDTPLFTERISKRICNCLALIQSIGLHQETKLLMVKANIPMYLHPFLNNKSKERANESVRLASLGVIGSLVKFQDEEVLHILLRSEVVPCCLNCMDVGNEWSKIIATFIIYRIILVDGGLKYCCAIAERFFAIEQALRRMVEKLFEEGNFGEDSSKRLLKHIIWCYHRFSEHPRACSGLSLCLPVKLGDSAIMKILQDDQKTLHYLLQLSHNVSAGHQYNPRGFQLAPGPVIRG